MKTAGDGRRNRWYEVILVFAPNWDMDMDVC